MICYWQAWICNWASSMYALHHILLLTHSLCNESLLVRYDIIQDYLSLLLFGCRIKLLFILIDQNLDVNIFWDTNNTGISWVIVYELITVSNHSYLCWCLYCLLVPLLFFCSLFQMSCINLLLCFCNSLWLLQKLSFINTRWGKSNLRYRFWKVWSTHIVVNYSCR